MKISEVLNESMGFDAVSLEQNPDFPKGVWGSVFPPESLEPYDYKRMHDMDYDGPPKNPEYNPELDMSLSNSNMSMILRDVLGFNGDSSDGFHIPIDQFINISTKWLQGKIGKQSQEVDSVVSQEPGKATMVDVGRPQGYENDVIMLMNKIAREGKAKGATHVGAW
jgi:hypothetical protein